MILLTGGLGFLGCNLAYYLAKQGEKVLLTQHRTSRIPSFIEPLIDKHISISACNILDFSNLFYILEKYPIKSVIHAAALYGKKEHLYQDLNVNVLGTMNILEASQIKKIKRISFTSSLSIYRRHRVRYHRENEDLPLDSPHTISLSKKMGEMMCHYYSKEYKLEILITRPSQIYGPLYTSGRSPVEKMVENSVMRKPINLPELAPNDGNDLIYVKDCARAIALIHLTDKPKYSIYNIGNKYVRYGEVAETVRKIIPDSRITFGRNLKRKAQEPLYLNIDRLKKEFGFKHEFNLENGIRDYIHWIRNGRY